MPIRSYTAVPHFVVHDTSGKEVRYRDIWQHDHLVLAVLDNSADAEEVGRWESIRPALAALGARLVITRDASEAGTAPSVLVADRWGEVVHASGAAGLPSPAEVLDWMDWVARRCPECEGEAD